jgi:hypothetical protein
MSNKTWSVLFGGAQIDVKSHKRWKEIKQRGIGRFLVVRGLLLAGLPFGIAMTVFQGAGIMAGWSSLLSSFMFHTTFFGLSMGYYAWWPLENAFAGQV